MALRLPRCLFLALMVPALTVSLRAEFKNGASILGSGDRLQSNQCMVNGQWAVAFVEKKVPCWIYWKGSHESGEYQRDYARGQVALFTRKGSSWQFDSWISRISMPKYFTTDQEHQLSPGNYLRLDPKGTMGVFMDIGYDGDPQYADDSGYRPHPSQIWFSKDHSPGFRLELLPEGTLQTQFQKKNSTTWVNGWWAHKPTHKKPARDDPKAPAVLDAFK